MRHVSCATVSYKIIHGSDAVPTPHAGIWLRASAGSLAGLAFAAKKNMPTRAKTRCNDKKSMLPVWLTIVEAGKRGLLIMFGQLLRLTKH
jgi:hypothetical protein